MAETKAVPFPAILPVDPAAAPVILEPAAAAVMLAASRDADPLEACGLLFGAAGQIRLASVARNIADCPRHRFEIDPQHLFEAQRRSRAGPHRIIGCWHSHPTGSPWPSARDRAGVQDIHWLWLIIANGAVRGFVPSVRGFTEVALQTSALVPENRHGTR